MKWTDKEITYLENNYESMPTKQIAKKLKRTEGAVRTKANLLGIRKLEPLYEVYKGDAFLATGTASECATDLGVSRDYIIWMTTPAAQKRLSDEHRTIAFKVKEDFHEIS